MSTQKDGHTVESRTSSGAAGVLADVLVDRRIMLVVDQQIRRPCRPLPRLDWPANLFCDALTN
jgi:hypothetical protein